MTLPDFNQVMYSITSQQLFVVCLFICNLWITSLDDRESDSVYLQTTVLGNWTCFHCEQGTHTHFRYATGRSPILLQLSGLPS